MSNPVDLDVMRRFPIGDTLRDFRASVASLCEQEGVSYSLDIFEVLPKDNLRMLFRKLMNVLTTDLETPWHLPSSRRNMCLGDDMGGLSRAVTLQTFDWNRIKPLWKACNDVNAEDRQIWAEVYKIVGESTPPPTMATPASQTPSRHTTSGVVNSTERRERMDRLLKQEIGSFLVGVKGFHETLLGRTEGFDQMCNSVFQKCIEGGNSALFGADGWQGWPAGAGQSEVLRWMAGIVSSLALFANSLNLPIKCHRKLLSEPNRIVPGSVAMRKLDVGFVENVKPKGSYHQWSEIIIPGELKSNPDADTAAQAWFDLSSYAREVFAAQPSRRFVIGFTLCGSLMRLWVFDRLGIFASERFDINEDGSLFVKTILAFLSVSEEELGFDPSITEESGQTHIEIRRADSVEKLVVEKVMTRSRCIVGRATTCWKVHGEGSSLPTLVVKDSWQYPERDIEGELLQEATKRNVINVADYYHHETVNVGGKVDDVLNNIRAGLDFTAAKRYKISAEDTTFSGSGGLSVSSVSSAKRTASQTGLEPSPQPAKRIQSSSSRPVEAEKAVNRIHRRVVVGSYGKPLYMASSPAALLAALEESVEGHRSLYNAGLLHRDISTNNIMINEKHGSVSAFLIDLDLAIMLDRQVASGAEGITGTRAFMAVGVLLGEQHSFKHDLESFFWVLFWICVFFEKPGGSRRMDQYEQWNYLDDDTLGALKAGIINTEAVMTQRVRNHFTPFYQPLGPCVLQLREELISQARRNDHEFMYDRVKAILYEHRQKLV